jgi:hypothetical protein
MLVSYQGKDGRHRHLGNVSSIDIKKFIRLTNDHSRDGEPVLRVNNFTSSSTQLSINLHTDIRAVLRLSLLYVGEVDTY